MRLRLHVFLLDVPTAENAEQTGMEILRAYR